jgi:predicted phosphodiesterase
MKYLILGDIHGNLPALIKTLETSLGEVDAVICHGDVVNYGPWSNECVDLLNDIGSINLMGNHEEAYLKGVYSGKHRLVHLFFNHTMQSFDRYDEIAKYQMQYSLENYNIVHTLNNQYFYPDTNLSELHLYKNTIIGHSHYAFVRYLKNGILLANTGSVGQNRVNLDIINYLILDDVTDSVEIKWVKYDANLVINKMVEMKYPEECLNYYRNKL